MRRAWRRIALVILVVLGVALAAGLVWLNDLADPSAEATAAMASDESVTVSANGAITFEPATPATTGFIFYPGGRVAAEAYAPQMRAIAEAGYLAAITPMPFGLAVLSPDAADGVIAAHPEIEHWIIGGHSLGGAMAAQHADGHDDVIDGLVLWAAYPAGGTDLSDADLVVTSISASEDGLASREEIAASAAQLPPDTTFVEIEGGNHAGFGSYGAQAGDGEATIAPQEQQAQTVAATLALVEAASAS
jgi:ABC-type transport system substrate-binding protein